MPRGHYLYQGPPGLRAGARGSLPISGAPRAGEGARGSLPISGPPGLRAGTPGSLPTIRPPLGLRASDPGVTTYIGAPPTSPEQKAGPGPLLRRSPCLVGGAGLIQKTRGGCRGPFPTLSCPRSVPLCAVTPPIPQHLTPLRPKPPAPASHQIDEPQGDFLRVFLVGFPLRPLGLRSLMFTKKREITAFRYIGWWRVLSQLKAGRWLALNPQQPVACPRPDSCTRALPACLVRLARTLPALPGGPQCPQLPGRIFSPPVRGAANVDACV